MISGQSRKGKPTFSSLKLHNQKRAEPIFELSSADSCVVWDFLSHWTKTFSDSSLQSVLTSYLLEPFLAVFWSSVFFISCPEQFQKLHWGLGPPPPTQPLLWRRKKLRVREQLIPYTHHLGDQGHGGWSNGDKDCVFLQAGWSRMLPFYFCL